MPLRSLERLQRLEQALQAQVKSWRLNPVVEALQALRGVQFTVAVTMVAEIGDLTRFDTPRELMKFLGLTPRNSPRANDANKGRLPKPVTPMPEGLWSKAPGPIAIPQKSVDTCNCDWKNTLKSSRTSVGKPRAGCVNATDDSCHEVNTPMWSPWPLPVSW